MWKRQYQTPIINRCRCVCESTRRNYAKKSEYVSDIILDTFSRMLCLVMKTTQNNNNSNTKNNNKNNSSSSSSSNNNNKWLLGPHLCGLGRETSGQLHHISTLWISFQAGRPLPLRGRYPIPPKHTLSDSPFQHCLNSFDFIPNSVVPLRRPVLW